MATISTLLKPAHGNSPRGRTPYYVDMSIDLTAQAISCTGGDVVQCLTIPANTRVLHAGFQVVESATMNTGTNATAILGAAVGVITNVASAQEGGITTQEGLVNVHPQEAIVPIEQLGGMINTAMTPVKDEISMLRRDMQSYFGFGGSAGKDIGKSVASNLVG